MLDEKRIIVTALIIYLRKVKKKKKINRIFFFQKRNAIKLSKTDTRLPKKCIKVYIVVSRREEFLKNPKLQTRTKKNKNNEGTESLLFAVWVAIRVKEVVSGRKAFFLK